MGFSGTVQGAAARKYAGFTYLKPVLAHVDIWQLDPDRLHPAHEYPRSSSRPNQSNIRALELADYMVEVGDAGSDGMSLVQVWMQPNEYTKANEPLLVWEFAAENALTLCHEHLDEALRRVFGGANAAPIWARW